jgi:hypothetical protein
MSRTHRGGTNDFGFGKLTDLGRSDNWIIGVRVKIQKLSTDHAESGYYDPTYPL